MGTTQDLQNQEAIKKIQELVEAANVCLFATALNQVPLSVRPMSTSKVDEDGHIWFFSKKNSDKNEHILEDDQVQLLYSNNSSSEYLSLYGHAEIVRDRNKIEELWTPMAKAWFTEGKEDPSITLLKVTPKEGHYWDTKNGKVISLIKIAVSALTGKASDIGVEGKLENKTSYFPNFVRTHK
ncbi:MAG: ral stress protein [Cytophagaceae bacterium]|jgi:general stress protein 26|nr:ral stress protein [Cytophagaceae bacterium]